jgi:acyl-[acyl carrier protein]--UDP-N-acetylglucosamine O-acyltransferase
VQIHASAIIHPKAQLGADVVVGPFCVVGEHVTIGPGTRLVSHVAVDGCANSIPLSRSAPRLNISIIRANRPRW